MESVITHTSGTAGAIMHVSVSGGGMYGHCGDDFIDALIDEANDRCGVLLNAIDGIPQRIPVCASKTVL